MSLIGQAPRYQQLAQALLNDIRGGRYQLGDLLPTEHALCSSFGASRFTVRQALQQLSELGMVTRQPGVGTRLISLEPSTVYRQGLESVSDILQYAEDTELEILDRQDLTLQAGDLPEFLRAAPGEVWLKARALRRSKASAAPPICFTEIFLPPAFRGLNGLSGRVENAVYRMIEQQFGEKIAEVRQEIRAGALPAEAAQVLSAKAKSPCLWISRFYLTERGQTAAVTRSLHPGERFHYQQVFRQSR